MTPLAMAAADAPAYAYFLSELWRSVQGDPTYLAHLRCDGRGSLPSVFAVTDLACAALGVAGLAVGEWMSLDGKGFPGLTVDRRLTSFWFQTSLRASGWTPPPPWDAIAGDYATADGWIRLHTNAPHHRMAALRVLGVAADRVAVTQAVSTWSAHALESAIVANGGCAAVMQTMPDWLMHPQGKAVANEPLMHHHAQPVSVRPESPPPRQQPLQGIRVLDLTRVLAGPVATRFLAGFGASVLRIDPPDWDEAPIVPEVTLGKRCATLDLKDTTQRETLCALLREADVLVHGYRPGALAGLGLDASIRRAINPRVIDVSLSAYGQTGPWHTRRGFDSLVQMSTGIAEAGMRGAGRDRPTPLPVQALDHAVGYLLAAAVVRGLTRRRTEGQIGTYHTSLARMAMLLMAGPPVQTCQTPLDAEHSGDLSPLIEATDWGPAQRLTPPLSIDSTPMLWAYPAKALGWSAAHWTLTPAPDNAPPNARATAPPAG